jgi:hypothetical protein
MYIPRTIIILVLLGMILVLGLTSSSTPTITNNSRHTFTWISQVTPELATWAKNLSFTDVIVLDSSEQDYLNLANEGITYWYLVTAQTFMRWNASKEFFKETLVSLIRQSPNRHIYLDDTQDSMPNSNFLKAVREIQASYNCSIILDGYVGNYSYLSGADMTKIAFDAYQPPTSPYDNVTPYLEKCKSIGFYVWIYACFGGGLSWDTMTDSYLDSTYAQAEIYNANRLVIWDGYDNRAQYDQCIYTACLYYYPEWWAKIKTKNMKFLGSNP